MAEPQKRLNFDPTINAGHILTFISMVVGVMVSYSLLDKRIGVLEERSATTTQRATDRDTEQKEALKEIRGDLKDLQRTVNEISRALATKK